MKKMFNDDNQYKVSKNEKVNKIDLDRKFCQNNLAISVKDHPVFVNNEDNDRVFTVSGKTSEFLNAQNQVTCLRLSKRPSSACGESRDYNPLRRHMSFIKETSKEDSLLKSSIQILVASLCAGFGNVGAGVILDMIQTWTVFKDISELFILVPSLLGLKGNLEMTMAARLSTEANLGHMNKWSVTLKMISGDMILVQCQATIVSFLAAIVAIIVNVCQSGTIVLNNCLDICASSLLTANVACFLLGLVMAFVIVFSHKINIDPDNIATPIAASLGDASTAGLFAIFAEWIHHNTRHSSTVPIVAIAVIASFAVLLPIFYIIARKNSFTHNLVHTGWTPIIAAMFISSGGGFFLDSAVERFDRLPPFQPVICGVGGNLVAVSASRISTSLHKKTKLGHLPVGVKRFSLPFKAFYNNIDMNTKMALILLSMAIPAHLLYSFVIHLIHTGITFTPPLVLLYIGFAALQVFILLYIGYNLVHILWSFSINPDNSSIPILTALGDLLGSGFLLLVFIILEKLNDPNAVYLSTTNNGTIFSNASFNTSTLLNNNNNITTF